MKFIKSLSIFCTLLKNISTICFIKYRIIKKKIEYSCDQKKSFGLFILYMGSQLVMIPLLIWSN